MRKISRRQFLKSGTAAPMYIGVTLAVPYIIPSSALGKAGTVVPSERITMGGIGLGSQGTRNMQNFMTHDDVRFIAVCDADTERRNKSKALVDANYGNNDCAAYTDFRELLACDDIDAVLIATAALY